MKLFDYFTQELKNYIRKEEFEPVKSLVYAVVGIILTAFIGALVALVFRK